MISCLEKRKEMSDFFDLINVGINYDNKKLKIYIDRR